MGNVGCPHLIRRYRSDVAIQQIRYDWQGVLRVRRDLVVTLVTAADAVHPHQPLDPHLAYDSAGALARSGSESICGGFGLTLNF